MRKVGVAVLVVTVLGLPLGLSALGANEEGQSAGAAAKKDSLPLEGMRAAVLTGEGFHDAETMMPMAFLANRGATVTLIGPEVGKVKAYNSDIHLFIQKSAADVAAAGFDVLVLPGGKAPARIRRNEAVVRFARQFFELGRPVAAICHGPQVLVGAGVAEGRTMTCVGSAADELREAGATYEDQAVVRAGHPITSRVARDIPAWLSAMETLMQEAGEKISAETP